MRLKRRAKATPSQSPQPNLTEDNTPNDGKPYVAAKEIQKQSKVGNATLRGWDKAGRVRTVRIGAGGKRLYSFLMSNSCCNSLSQPKLKTSFKRKEPPPSPQPESSLPGQSHLLPGVLPKQKEDLTRQRALLEQRYPGDDVIEDIASGVNLHRRGLVTLLERAIGGGISEVVVLHRDRLARIAFELIECVLRACKCQIVVCDHDDEAASAYSSTNDKR